MLSLKPRKPHFAVCKRMEHEQSVRPHMAYDPKELDALRKQGKSISNANVEGLYYDGDIINSDNFRLPMDSIRGVDINDMWNYQQRTNRTRSRLGVSVGSADVNISK